jgi:hypothetical protein
VVRCQALEWTGRQLRLGGPTLQDAVRSLDGAGVAPALRPGDWVALHWGWVCDRLSLRQLVTLRQYTAMHLDIANDIVDSPVGRRGIAPVLDEG